MKYPERLEPLDAIKKAINRASSSCWCRAVFGGKDSPPSRKDPCPHCGYPYTIIEIAEAVRPKESGGEHCGEEDCNEIS